MSAIVPFESAQLPAHIATMFGQTADDLTSGVGGGFPSISIKGKVFHIVRGDERTMVTRPENPDEPASSIEVVILKANPGLSKVYYPTGYTEGSDEKPTCYSNDGITPANDAATPQAMKCAACTHNTWGSKISENGSKVKACSDSRRLAIAPVGQINDPMLLRVPAASLAPLAELGKSLAKRGVPYQAVITRVSFDFTVAHPQLKFAPIGFLSEDLVPKIREVMDSDTVKKIIGDMPPKGEGAAPRVAAPAPAPAIAAQPAPAVQPIPAQQATMTAAPAAAPKPAAKPAAPKKATAPATSAFSSGVAPAEAAPVATVTATPAPAPAVQPVVEINAGDLDKQLDAVLAGAGFDD
jgi:hypothetical protein